MAALKTLPPIRYDRFFRTKSLRIKRQRNIKHNLVQYQARLRMERNSRSKQKDVCLKIIGLNRR